MHPHQGWADLCSAVIVILVLELAAAVCHHQNQTVDTGVKRRVEATSGGSPPQFILSFVTIVAPSLAQLAQ